MADNEIINRRPDEEIELGSITVETGSHPTASVIWLHGLGADGSDFESIVPQLMLPAEQPVRFIFPDAPLRQVTINGGYMMRAWYDIYENISLDAEQDEEGIMESAKIISMLVNHEIERGIASHRIILAGFSQGGSIALYAGLKSEHHLGGIIALSTWLPLSDHFQGVVCKPAPVPSIFMAHGEQDPVVPIQFAEASKEILKKLCTDIEWHTYPMAHSVNPPEILAIREWLIRRLQADRPAQAQQLAD